MIKNIAANFIGRFLSIFTNFLFIPIYIHYLGFESYSIISFTLVIASLMAVLDGGLTSTLSREFARTDNTFAEKIRIFKTLESTYFILIILCILFVFVFSGIIANNWLNLEGINPQKVSFFLKIISFDVGFQLLLRFYMGGLMGLEKQIKANLYQTGWGLFRNGFVILAILIVPSLEMFFVWQTISTIVFTILFGLSLRKELTGVFKFDFQFQIENIVLKNIWRFAGGMLLINLIASINTQMDKLIISKLLLIENLGYYTLAVSLAMGILVLVNPISAAVLPRFTALYSAGEKKRASNLFYKLNLIVAILVFSIMANMTFFAKDIIWIWTGKMDLAEHAYRLIPVIVFAYSMLSLQVIPYNIAIANGYTKLNNYMGIISLFVTFPGYWFATTIYGPIGAAYVFCTVQTITTFIYLYVILKKFTINRSIISTYIFQIIFPLLITLAVAFMFSFIPLWVSSNRFISLTWIGIAIICSFFAATIILVPNVELKRIKNFIKIN